MTASGPLLAADEAFTHQIADTFARVSQSDRAWTEKVWAMAAARDGSLSVAFGLGKYVNRNVMDAFAGVSRRDRAVDGAGQPQAGADAGADRGRPDHLRDRRAAAADPDRAGAQRRRRRSASTSRSRARSRPAVEDREIHVSRSRYRHRRRRGALPPGGRGQRLGRASTASGSRSTTRAGSARGIARGACATAWASRSATSRRHRSRRARPRSCCGCP